MLAPSPQLKATPAQQTLLFNMLDAQMRQMNLGINALTGTADCWICLNRYLAQASNQDWSGHWPRLWPYIERPAGFGTHRDWLLDGLNDSHIESAFKYILRGAVV